MIKKRKKQFYIQTWHGALGFKRIEKDSVELLSKEYVKYAQNDSKNIDLLLTNCKWQEDYFKKYFWYDGKILVEGLPRNDVLFDIESNKKIIKKFKSNYNIDDNTKILLYAPTFRNNKKTDCYNIDYDKLLLTLEKKYNCKWILLMRFHPNMSDVFFPNRENIINVSNYPNINELLIVSDMLISDYSSLIFEFSYLYKPIIMYASDIKEYEKERGFCIDITKVPFNIVKNNKELSDVIINYNSDNYIEKLNNFFKECGLNESGNSSKIVADIIINKISK